MSRGRARGCGMPRLARLSRLLRGQHGAAQGSSQPSAPGFRRTPTVLLIRKQSNEERNRRPMPDSEPAQGVFSESNLSERLRSLAFSLPQRRYGSSRSPAGTARPVPHRPANGAPRTRSPRSIAPRCGRPEAKLLEAQDLLDDRSRRPSRHSADLTCRSVTQPADAWEDRGAPGPRPKTPPYSPAECSRS